MLVLCNEPLLRACEPGDAAAALIRLLLTQSSMQGFLWNSGDHSPEAKLDTPIFLKCPSPPPSGPLAGRGA